MPRPASDLCCPTNLTGVCCPALVRAGVGRSLFGETKQGEGLEERFTQQQVTIGANVLSTVSLRYNQPQ